MAPMLNQTAAKMNSELVWQYPPPRRGPRPNHCIPLIWTAKRRQATAKSKSDDSRGKTRSKQVKKASKCEDAGQKNVQKTSDQQRSEDQGFR